MLSKDRIVLFLKTKIPLLSQKCVKIKFILLPFFSFTVNYRHKIFYQKSLIQQYFMLLKDKVSHDSFVNTFSGICFCI